MMIYIKKIGNKLRLLILYVKYLYLYIFSKKSVVIKYQTFSTNIGLKDGNYGDALNLPFFTEILNRQVIPYKYSLLHRVTNCKPIVVGIGSVLLFYNIDDCIICGSGIVDDNKELKGIPRAIVCVRGPLTRQYLNDRNVYCPDILGDPAILLPLLYNPIVKKRYKLGIIPHYSQFNSDVYKKLNENQDVILIDIKRERRDWREFIDLMLSCECIISSSLHGLIISDTYDIPNLWLIDGYTTHTNETFKFEDYYKSVGITDANTISVDSQTPLSTILSECKSWSSRNYYTKKEVLLEHIKSSLNELL